MYQNRPIVSIGPREACEELRFRAAGEDSPFLADDEVSTVIASISPSLDKAILAARERAEVRAAAKRAQNTNNRRIVAVALGAALGCLPSLEMVGEDLAIAPGVYGDVTTRNGVRAVKRCRCGHEIRGVYLTSPNESTLADLGDLLLSTEGCAMCGSGDEIAQLMAAIDEGLEAVINHLYQAVGEDKSAWTYHVGVSLQRLEGHLRDLREARK